jgi:hypothetical protein
MRQSRASLSMTPLPGSPHSGVPGPTPGRNPSTTYRDHDYVIDTMLTTSRDRARCAHSRSSEGPSPETSRRRSGEWRPAAAARNRRPREVRDPARQALRPGCEELAARIRKKCRRWKRGPRPKIATVERREASASRWTRAAPQSARMVAPDSATETAPFGAPLAPHGADGKERSKTRAQKRAGNEEECAV